MRDLNTHYNEINSLEIQCKEQNKEIEDLKEELEQARQCLSFKESAQLIAENKKLKLSNKILMEAYDLLKKEF